MSLIQRDPEVYDRPNEFRPERFLDEKPPSSHWIPFGGGVRRCLAAPFALLEMRVVIQTGPLAAEADARSSGLETTRAEGAIIVPDEGVRVASRARARETAPATRSTSFSPIGRAEPPSARSAGAASSGGHPFTGRRRSASEQVRTGALLVRRRRARRSSPRAARSPPVVRRRHLRPAQPFGFSDPDSESSRAYDIIEDATGEQAVPARPPGGRSRTRRRTEAPGVRTRCRGSLGTIEGIGP